MNFIRLTTIKGEKVVVAVDKVNYVVQTRKATEIYVMGAPEYFQGRIEVNEPIEYVLDKLEEAKNS